MAQQRRENDGLVAALREAEQQLRFGSQQWKEDKNFYLSVLEKSQVHHHAELERQTNKYNKLVAALKNAESQLESGQRKWQWEKITLLKDMDKLKASFLVKAEEQRREIEKLSAALEKSEVQIERNQKEKTSLLEEMEKLKASHEVKVDEQERDIEKLTAALKEAEDKVESDGLRWRQEKSSLLARLDEQTRRNDAFVPALERFEQQLKSHQRLVERQEEKSSLLQTADSLGRSLEEKEQEWTGAAMEAKLDDLESRLATKTSRRKRKFKFF